MSKLIICFFLILTGAGLVHPGYAQSNLYDRIHDTIAGVLKNPEGGKQLYFHRQTLLTSRDSFTVIGAEYGGYAVINHDQKSKGHQTFSAENIRKWKDRRMDDCAVNRSLVVDSIRRNRSIDPVVLSLFKGYWVPLRKWQGNYYLEHDWSNLIAYELTDSTWVAVDMEVFPEPLTMVKGNREHFILQTGYRSENFELIDREHEIYRKGSEYLIPVRRINDFEMIEYINTTGDLLFAFIKYDRE